MQIFQVLQSEQATATSQIDDALAQVAQVVQTNSATSEECASASEELSGQAHGLENILTRFKIKDGQNNFGIYQIMVYQMITTVI